MSSKILPIVFQSILACSLSGVVLLCGGCVTVPVNYGEPVKVLSSEIDGTPAIVFDTICKYFRGQHAYEIENKNMSGGIVTVQTKMDYPLRYIFIIDQPSATKCSLIIRGLVGVDLRTRRHDIPEGVFDALEKTMDEFMQEIKRRVKERI